MKYGTSGSGGIISVIGTAINYISGVIGSQYSSLQYAVAIGGKVFLMKCEGSLRGGIFDIVKLTKYDGTAFGIANTNASTSGESVEVYT